MRATCAFFARLMSRVAALALARLARISKICRSRLRGAGKCLSTGGTSQNLAARRSARCAQAINVDGGGAMRG